MNGLDEIQSKLLPKFNRAVVESVAAKQLEGAKEFVELTLRSASVDFPESVTFTGCRYLLPHEEYEVYAPNNRSSSKWYMEMSKSDTYMIALNFEFNNEPFPAPIYLSLNFAGLGGVTYVRGKKLQVLPVLADILITRELESIFVTLGRAKQNYERIQTQFLRYDHESDLGAVSELGYVMYAHLHNKGTKKRGVKTIKPATILYAMAKYGLTGVFTELLGIDVQFGDDLDYKKLDPKEWIIFGSSGIKPRSYRKRAGRDYSRPTMRLAVKVADYDPVVKSFIASVIYLMDHYPDKVNPKSMDSESDRLRGWSARMILHDIVWRNPGQSEAKKEHEVTSHMLSLEGNIDPQVKKQLRALDLKVDDFYGLIVHLTKLMTEPSNSVSGVSSLYGKQLNTLRYLLDGVIHGINSTMYLLGSNRANNLDAKKVYEAFKRNIRRDEVMNIGGKDEVDAVSCVTDNYLIGLTGSIATQEKANKPKGGRRVGSRPDNPKLHLNGSYAEASMYLSRVKADTSCRNRINPFVKLTPDYVVEPDTDDEPLQDAIARAQVRLDLKH